MDELNMAQPPGSAEDRAAAAEAILVGVLERVSISDETAGKDFANRSYVLDLKVESVEKGPGVERATVKGWTALVRPQGWAGPAGIHDLHGLRAGDHVRVYVRDSQIVEPDGVEKLTAGPEAHIAG